MTRGHRTALVTAVAFAIAAPAAGSQPPSRRNTVGTAEVARTPQTTARESVTRSAVSATVSRERALEVLGGSQRLRVVRASGVTDVAPSATAVTVAPGDFLFRKLSDTARRVRVHAVGGQPQAAARIDIEAFAAGAPQPRIAFGEGRRNRTIERSELLPGRHLLLRKGARDYALVRLRD